jgi:hypothetical protein
MLLTAHYALLSHSVPSVPSFKLLAQSNTGFCILSHPLMTAVRSRTLPGRPEAKEISSLSMPCGGGFLSSAQDGGKLSTSRTGHFLPWNQLDRRLGGPQSWAWGYKEIILLLLPGLKPRPSSPHPHHDIDCANPLCETTPL